MDSKTAKTIKELRYRLGLTQEQFAMAVGVTATTVQRWESGHSQPSPMAQKLIAELNTALPRK